MHFMNNLHALAGCMVNAGCGGKWLAVIHGKIESRFSRDLAYFNPPALPEHRVSLELPSANTTSVER
jgi:hypothetical protein